MTTRAEIIKDRLHEAFNPEVLELYDDSQSHAGHAGVRESGGGHFFATIVSQVFEGKGPVRRHQLVYEALGELMKSEIHALSIKAFTPIEYQHKGS